MKKLSFYFLLLFALLFSASCESETDDVSPSEASELGYSSDVGRGGGGSGEPSAPGGQVTDSIPAGQVTAGEWNDLDNWSFWQQLMQKPEFDSIPDVWELYTERRFSFKVTGSTGAAVANAKVELINGRAQLDYTARTDNRGYAELFKSFEDAISTEEIPSARITSPDGTVSTVVTAYPGARAANEVQLQWSPNPAANSVDIVELAFVVDATGSMGDEIQYLQAELQDVLSRVQNSASVAPPMFRFGSVFYRDVEDDYLTRVQQFTESPAQITNFIRAQEANGGGDWEEAVDEALDVAVNQLNWSDDGRARMLFLLLDAPPHNNERVKTRMQRTLKAAAAKGIMIVPISASGIDKGTEFLLRIMAIATNGTYTFVTNHSGIGNEKIEPTVGQYEVEYLNDLLVRLVRERVEYQ